MKIITARNMQELETAINATVGLDCSKVSMISDGNCYAVMGDTTKPSLSATTNGTYNEGPYGTVTVGVPNGTETTIITENGTYTPTSPNIGFSSVVVNVTPTLQDKTVSIATLVSGGTITCDEGYDGLGTITLTE